MDFYDIFDQVVDLLKQRGRTSYRALKVQFKLDDEAIEALKEEIIKVHQLAVDQNGEMMVWASKIGDTPGPTSPPEQTTRPDTQEAESTLGETQPAETHTPDAAERRQLTVMFCDLVGSTHLSGELDPEDLREVVKAYQAACTEVIQRYDGHVAQLLGDGLLVYFGYPVAHEDDAQRAIHTGLGILKAIGDLNTRLEPDKGIRLAVRLGIHTGLVVIGEMGGEGRQEQLALGDTPNIAARIQGLAEPDTVVISADTHRLVQGYFDCEPLGEHDLRGVVEPLAVHQVLKVSETQGRFEIASTRGLTPLVGRESESTLLFERWAQVKDGNGQVVLLSGEAGIGKSRLVQMLRDHVSDEPHTRLECRSSPYFTNSTLYPIIDMVQRTLRFQTDDTPELKLEKLEQNLSQYQLPLEETVPLFAALLSFPVPEDQYPLLNLTPQRQRQMTLETIVTMLLELAEQQPVLFVIEDLHWTDPSTLELLDLLVDQTPTASIYTLLTCRPEFQTQWANRSYFTQVTLNRLSREDIEQMVARVTDGKPLPPEIIQQLVDKTDGVPLYVEEMTKAVLESGILKEIDGQYALIGPVSSLAIPTTLQDSLMARLDRLVTAKAIAQYASVIGRQFSYALLQAVSQLDETMLQYELDRLAEAELVYQRGLPPNATYIFKHALVQDTAYESLLRSTRQGYHRRIAEVLEDQFSETARHQPELLAHHYTAAGLNEKALTYWHRAGEHANTHSAYVEAVAHFRKGLEVLQVLPETSARAEVELAVQFDLATSLVVTIGYTVDEVERALTRAYELCQQVGETRMLIPVLQGLRRLYALRGENGDGQRAREFAEQLLMLTQRQHNTTLQQEAHWALGQTLCYLGELQPARTHLEHSRACYTPHPLTSATSRDAAGTQIACLVHLAWSLVALGYLDQALTVSQEALSLAHNLSHPFTLAFAFCGVAQTHQLRRDVQATQDQTDAMIALANDQGFPVWVARGTLLCGWLLALQGHPDEGAHQMREVLETQRSFINNSVCPLMYAMLTEAYGAGSQIQEGLCMATEALAFVERTGFRQYEAELHRLKGQLLLQQSSGNQAEAETCFHQAITIAQSQNTKSWELRATTSLAKLWRSQGKREEARELLEPVYSWFTEGFDTLDLKDAKALLDELS